MIWWKLPIFIIWLGLSLLYLCFGLGALWDHFKTDQSQDWITSGDLSAITLGGASASLLMLLFASTEGWVWPLS